MTSERATIEGFIIQARDKVRLATPHIEEARLLLSGLKAVHGPQEALKRNSIRHALLSAAGLSEKALGHLLPEDQVRLLNEVLSEIQRQGSKDWKQEVVLRFALTRGDALGGSSRNLAGANAKNLFAGAVVEAASLTGPRPVVSLARGGKRKVQSIAWNDRLMVFDRTPRIVGKNIDVIMLEDDHESAAKDLLEKKAAYIACGEVKGGIDPAGADEHWKTANSALDRVRSSFGLKRPALFFAAAAIEDSMAGEIISQLRDNRLTFSANLTRPEQVKDLADWIVGL